MGLFCRAPIRREGGQGVAPTAGPRGLGHVIAQLLSELPPGTAASPKDLIERAKVLDNFYISTRYPNAHPEGAPFEHYGPLQSEQALEHAGAILDFARSKMA